MSERSTTRFVVWLDPGLTTGWATYDLSQHEFKSGQGDLFATGTRLTSLAKWYRGGLAVGWERYLVLPGSGGITGTAEPSLETIGMARWICLSHGVTVLDPVPSAMRKLGGDDKLRRLSWYHPGQRHANDAANHLLSWFLRSGTLPGHLHGQLFTDDLGT
jgi:hypothetical protein